MERPLIIVALFIALLLPEPSVRAAGSFDFALFDDIDSIGDGAADPRPRDDELLLLQFWASWCHSCGSLMWDMDEIASRGKRVKYVAVSLDDDREAAATYIRKHQLFPKYSDRYFLDSSKSLSSALDIQTVPSIVLVNASGDVLLAKSGHLNSTDLNDIVTVIREQQ